MKTLLALVLVLVMTCGAVASDPPGYATLALFFSPNDSGYDGLQTTNSDILTTSGFSGPFAWTYLVVVNPGIDFFWTLEFGIKSEAWVEGWSSRTLLGPEPKFVASEDFDGGYSAIWTWPEGFPLVSGGATAVAHFRLLNWFSDTSTLQLGPMRHLAPTFPGWPVIIFGPNSETDYRLLLPPVDQDTIDEDGYAVVATYFGDGVTATEDHTLSCVKALFR